jgi:hypothetical protein
MALDPKWAGIDNLSPCSLLVVGHEFPIRRALFFLWGFENAKPLMICRAAFDLQRHTAFKCKRW